MAIAICIICCDSAFFDKKSGPVFHFEIGLFFGVPVLSLSLSLSQSRLAAEGLMPKRALKSRLKWLRLA